MGRLLLGLARVGFAVLAAVPASPAFGQEEGAPSLEYRVKAAFLLNFAKLTEWPASVFKTPDSPLVVCVVGRNPFGSALQATFDNETAQGRPLEARVIRTADDPSDCHMLFVPRGVPERWIVDISSRARRMVTIGESERFLDEGGCISFVVESGRVRFDISQDAASRQGVKFSSHLLRLARRSDGPPGERS